MLHIQQDRLEWQDVQAETGLHAIHATSGRVSWDDPQIPFAIENLAGELDAASLYQHLDAYPQVRDDLLAGLTGVTRRP